MKNFCRLTLELADQCARQRERESEIERERERERENGSRAAEREGHVFNLSSSDDFCVRGFACLLKTIELL